jgi:hypothetical protein
MGSNHTQSLERIQSVYHYLKFVQGITNIDEIIVNTLAVKGDEYSTDDDRYINFRHGADWINSKLNGVSISPKVMLLCLVSKHVDWCKNFLYNDLAASEEKILEHFGDVLNYMILLYIGFNDLER